NITVDALDTALDAGIEFAANDLVTVTVGAGELAGAIESARSGDLGSADIALDFTDTDNTPTQSALSALGTLNYVADGEETITFATGLDSATLYGEVEHYVLATGSQSAEVETGVGSIDARALVIGDMLILTGSAVVEVSLAAGDL